MKKIFAGAVLAAFVGMAGASQASTVTIDFNVPDEDLTSAPPYIEDGFQIGAVGETLIDNGRFYISALSPGDTTSLSRVGGGLFSLTSFGYASHRTSLSDAFDLLGFKGGVEVADFGNYSTSSNSIITVQVNSIV